MATIDISLDGLAETIGELEAMQGDWADRHASLTPTDMTGQGSTPQLANDIARRFDQVYTALELLIGNTRSFYEGARENMVEVDMSTASQFE